MGILLADKSYDTQEPALSIRNQTMGTGQAQKPVRRATFSEKFTKTDYRNLRSFFPVTFELIFVLVRLRSNTVLCREQGFPVRTSFDDSESQTHLTMKRRLYTFG